MKFRDRIAYSLVTGYILTFYSEWMFWAGRPNGEESVLAAVPSWLAYSFITYLFLMCVSYFRVQSVWAVFIAGAVYGWLLEGVLVQTMYDLFPLNISNTGLSWHAMITVLFGWYWLPRLLQRSSAIAACIVYGLCLGVWMIGWWLEPGLPVAPFGSVFVYNMVFGVLLVPAYMWQSRWSLADFKPTRREAIAALVLLALYYTFVTIPTQPLALVVLPPLLVIVLWALRKNRQRAAEIQPVPARITLRQVLPVILIPLTSSLVYAAAQMTGMQVPGLQIVFIITVPLGFIMLALSIYKTVRVVATS